MRFDQCDMVMMMQTTDACNADYGYRVPSASPARSDTSEELVVDGVDGESGDCPRTPEAVDLTRSQPTTASEFYSLKAKDNGARNSPVGVVPLVADGVATRPIATQEPPVARRLAFSVENILDPNKFTGGKDWTRTRPLWADDRDGSESGM